MLIDRYRGAEGVYVREQKKKKKKKKQYHYQVCI